MFDYREDALALREELITHRRQLHRDPEVGLHLPRTRAYVMEQLRGYGCAPIAVSYTHLTLPTKLEV